VQSLAVAWRRATAQYAWPMAGGRPGSHCVGHSVFSGDRAADVGGDTGDDGGFLGGTFLRLANAIDAEFRLRICLVSAGGAMANWGGARRFRGRHRARRAVPWRSGASLVVLGVDIALGRHWLEGTGNVTKVLRTWSRRKIRVGAEE